MMGKFTNAYLENRAEVEVAVNANVREALRKWAYENDMQNLTSGERLLAVWGKVHELIPDMPEDAWAFAIDWAFPIGKFGPDPMKINMADWENFKANTTTIDGHCQCGRASHVTGLPYKWFLTGNRYYVAPVSFDTATVNELLMEIMAQGLEPADVLAMLRSK